MKRYAECGLLIRKKVGQIAARIFRPGQGKNNYLCPICHREIDEKNALTHIKTEEYILSLITKDHPEWKNKDGACPECVAYYRELVKKAKI